MTHIFISYRQANIGQYSLMQTTIRSHNINHAHVSELQNVIADALTLCSDLVLTNCVLFVGALVCNKNYIHKYKMNTAFH